MGVKKEKEAERGKKEKNWKEEKWQRKRKNEKRDWVELELTIL